MVRNLEAIITHRGSDYKNFYNQLEGSYNGQRMQLGTTWSMNSGAKLEVVCTNPWKNFNTKFEYTGK